MDNNKTIKVNYIDFWQGFSPRNFYIHNILKKHYHVIISDSPDYWFCSVFGEEHKNRGGIKIFYSGENIMPDYSQYDYAIDFFDYEKEDRHFQGPIYLITNDQRKVAAQMMNKHIYARQTSDSKLLNRKFCSFVYSNPVEMRKSFQDALSAYKNVNYAGKLGGGKIISSKVSGKIAFEKKHKFSIAFENVSNTDYITEKIVNSFAACTVPIYFGANNISDYFNPDAMVIVESEEGYAKVIERIKEIDRDDELYLKMLRTPAILPDKQSFFDNYDTNLEKFICHIFDQECNYAFRC